MAVNISYKCPNCGAELFWSADKNCWACEYCDGQFTLKDLEEAGGDAKKAEELNKDNVEKHRDRKSTRLNSSHHRIGGGGVWV